MKILQEKYKSPSEAELHAVRFRIVVRDRRSGNTIPFEELSAIICTTDPTHATSGIIKPSTAKGKKGKTETAPTIQQVAEKKWYYSFGIVEPIKDEVS